MYGLVCFSLLESLFEELECINITEVKTQADCIPTCVFFKDDLTTEVAS